MIDLFERTPWQMMIGERAALDGVLASLRPQLAVEIGTAEGGSLKCIAARAHEVHSFDLVPPAEDIARLPNVTLHSGDSHALLPGVLARFEQDGRNIDFVLVDGDHTTDGVRRDVEDLLASGAVSETMILVHDTANEGVRAGLEAVDYTSFAKVTAVDLDFVPGYLVRSSPFHHEIWGGIGLIAVSSRGRGRAMQLVSNVAYSATEVLAAFRQARLGHMATPLEDAELAQLRVRAADLERQLRVMVTSRSWRITRPIRQLAARVRG